MSLLPPLHPLPCAPRLTPLRLVRHSRPLRLALLALAALAAGCSIYRNDRCYVPPEQYRIARDLFVQTGSLDVVKKRLQDFEWRTCRINETLYHISKEFQVLPEELPTAANNTATTGTAEAK